MIEKFEIPTGTEAQFTNANPANADAVVSLADGSFIRFTIPSNGTFRMLSNGSIVGIDWIAGERQPLGPRRLEDDVKNTT